MSRRAHRCSAWIMATVVAACAGPGTAQSHAAAGASAPFGGVPFLIAARGESRLEAENFDRGEEGVAYHDTDAANAGRQYRPNDGVDIGLCNDVGGGYRVGWIAAGEWLKYSVRVSSAGSYHIAFRVSSRASAGAALTKLHLEDETGKNLTGDVSVVGTNDAWQDIRANDVALPAGDHVLKLVFDGGGFNLNYMTFSPAQSQSEQQVPVAQTTQQGAGAGEVVIVTEETGGQAVASNDAGAATSSLGAFAEENSIGETKGQVRYAQSGAYTLHGGKKVGGTADTVYLLSSRSQGDGQLVAKVESVEGAGSAGVMYRESAAAGSRFAAVLVSGSDGVRFQRRAETAGSVFSAMAPAAKPPVWIRLVRSGTNFSAFYSTSAERPGDGEWKPIGSAKPVAMSAEALAGLAAATDEGAAVVSAVSATGAMAEAAPVEVRGSESVVTGEGAATGAALTGSYADVTGKVVDLSAGAIDWVHFGHNMQQENRKANVPRRIGALDAGGGKIMLFGDNVAKYSWTDGAPTASASASSCGAFTDSGVVRLTVKPGDTRPHVLTVYVGGFKTGAQLTATVPGARPYSDGPRRNTSGTHFAAAYTLNVRVASPDAVVTVEWKQVDGVGGNIQFHGAQLR